MTTPDTLRYVEGELNYLVPMPERPRYFAYDAGPDAPTNMAHEAHRVRIHDMRPISHEVTLDSKGFALVEQRTAVRDFWNEDEVHEVYYPRGRAFPRRGDRGQPRLHLRPRPAPPHSGRNAPGTGRYRPSRRRASMSTTPRNPGRNACATCWARMPRSC